MIGAMPSPMLAAMRLAAVAGTCIATATLVAASPAANVDGVMVTTDPVGAPVAVSVAAAGKVVPAEGEMVSEYVAVPPAATVADELPPVAVAKVKSETICETAELVKVENCVSPL